MRTHKLTMLIAIAMILGITTGYMVNTMASPVQVKEISDYFTLATNIFLRLIKMIIAPLVFSTVVAGIANMGNSKAVGRVGMKTLCWFLIASIISLSLGCLMANLLEPGTSADALTLELPHTLASDLPPVHTSFKDFILNIFPKSIAESFVKNEILQILVFSVFFGLAIASLPKGSASYLTKLADEILHVMIKITDFVMQFAPIAVFSAMATAIATEGLGVLVTYGRLIGSVYLSFVLLCAVLTFMGWFFLRDRIFTLLNMMRSVILLAFSTASSEAAYPKTIEQLEKFGASNRITSFVLPMAYAFNLDGSMTYLAFAMMFIAQVYGIHMPISTQLAMLFILMISSKGVAGVPRSSLVVLSATLPMFQMPESGIVLMMAVDQFLDMGRTATNVVGNSIATAIVAKWEGQLGSTIQDDHDLPESIE